jgi:serine/threonine-protein kinase
LLQKSLEKRYNNASELSVDLQLVKRSLAMRPTRRPFGLWLARQRNTILRIVLPAAAAAVLIGVVLNWAPWRQMRGLRSPEKTAIAQFTFDLQEGHELVMGHGNSLALSPDGKQLVYLAESDGKRKLFLRRMDQLSAKAVEGSDGAVFPFFSPDGDWVGFGAEGKLRKASLETGSVVSLCDAPNLCGGSWSRDGQIAFIPESQAGVHLVSSSGGLSKKLHMRQTESGSAKHWHPFFLPGGNAILTTVWTTSYYEAARVAVVSLKTGDRKILLEDASWPFFLPPDHIVFARRNGLYAVRFDPLRMELRGEPFKLFEALTEPNDSHFAVSANGTLVLASGLDQDARPSWKEERAYWREERVPVWVERSGAVHPVPLPPGPYAFPNVSPDGTKLALSVFREKAVENWMLDVESGVFSRLTVDRNDHISVWSPDGKQIAMSSATSGVPNIYVMPVDGTAPPERLTVSEFHQDPASWSPDGRFLTFLDFFTQNQFDIWLIDLTRGRESRPLIKTQFDERHAMISPDGKCMAYTSNRSGQREIYVCSFPDGNAIGQVTSEGGSDPLWSRDGRELFFWEWNKKVDQDDHEPLSLMAMTVGTHDGMRFGKPTPLFKRSWVYHNGGRPNYDVAPDGRFVMLDYKGETSSITRLRVLLNWLDELED